MSKTPPSQLKATNNYKKRHMVTTLTINVTPDELARIDELRGDKTRHGFIKSQIFKTMGAKIVTNDLGKQAMALYKPPFVYNGGGWVIDSENRIVVELREPSRGVFKHSPEDVYHEFGAVVTQALNEFYENHGDKS